MLSIVDTGLISFSFLYEAKRDLTFGGIIAAMTWMITEMYWFVIFAQNPSASIALLFVSPEVTYFTVGLFFSGIGIIYIVRVIIDLISMRNLGREITGDLDY